MSTVVDNKGLEAPSPVAAFLKRNMQLLLVTVALFVVLAFFSVAVPNFTFATMNVYLDIVLQSAFTGVMALGATFVIATSGIDLSVGTGMSLVAVMAGIFLAGDKMNLPLGLGLLLTLLVGMAIGLINGLNVSILGLPPFIATLAMMMVARGLALIISNKSSIVIANTGYKAIAAGKAIPGVANAIVIFLVLTVLATFLMNKTLLGRYALAIGSNEEATRLSGVNVRLWKIIIYVVAGAFMAVGAVLYSARGGLVQPAEGVGMELNVIAAAVIGGTSLSGGRASIPGALVGAILMETLKKGLTMMSIAAEWQFVVTGTSCSSRSSSTTCVASAKTQPESYSISITTREPPSVHSPDRRESSRHPTKGTPMRPIGRIVAAAAVGTLALGMAACSTSTDATGGSTKTESSGASKVDTSGEQQDWEKEAVKGDGSQTIYLVSKGFQHRFWQAVKEGAEQAGEELGYKVSFVGPQDETKVTEQTDQLKSALDSGPAAIGFAALDSNAAADLLSEIKSKNIPGCRLRLRR